VNNYRYNTKGIAMDTNETKIHTVTSKDTGIRYYKRLEIISDAVRVCAYVSAAIALSIVLASIVAVLIGREITGPLETWGGIIIGFYFGSFSTLLNSFVSTSNQLERDRTLGNSHQQVIESGTRQNPEGD
jgi:hypothetical protein